MTSLSLTGGHINVYINNKLYKQTQSLTLDIDYSEEEIYGIDTPWAQEIAGGRARVHGSIRGLRFKNSGGLQGSNIRPGFMDMAASPYISIRIQDRSSNEDIALITNAKTTNEKHSIDKGVYKLDFDFVGQIILYALDRAT
jgi:hypothetical protein